MKCTDYEFQDILCIIASQMSKPSHFTSWWGDSVFMIMLGSYENSHNFFSSIKNLSF
jgi:hypothetical protein